MLAVMAISAASSVIQAQGQQKAANAQAKAMGEQANAEQNALGLRSQQEGEAAAHQMNERAKAARLEAAQFDAIGAEYGGGVSASRQAQAIAFGRESDLATIAANRNAALSQVGQESRGTNARLNAGLASLNRPNKAAIALTIAGNAASTYSAFQKPKPPVT